MNKTTLISRRRRTERTAVGRCFKSLVDRETRASDKPPMRCRKILRFFTPLVVQIRVVQGLLSGRNRLLILFFFFLNKPQIRREK